MQSFSAQMKDFADDKISVEGPKKKASEAWSQVVPVTKPKPNLNSNLALENAQKSVNHWKEQHRFLQVACTKRYKELKKTMANLVSDSARVT